MTFRESADYGLDEPVAIEIIPRRLAEPRARSGGAKAKESVARISSGETEPAPPMDQPVAASEATRFADVAPWHLMP